MNKVKPPLKIGTLISQRYRLGICLLDDACGGLYQAIDMQAGQANSERQVLVHFLPDTIGDVQFDSALKKDTSSIAQLLAILDTGWAEGSYYVVLHAPAHWSLTKLLPQPHSTQTTIATLNQLLQQQGFIEQPLGAECFVTNPEGEIYVLGSALLKPMQQLSLTAKPIALENTSIPQLRQARYQLGLVLLGLTLSAAAALYYSTHQPETLTQAATSPSAVALTNSVEAAPAQHDTAPISSTLIATPEVAAPASTAVDKPVESVALVPETVPTAPLPTTSAPLVTDLTVPSAADVPTLPTAIVANVEQPSSMAHQEALATAQTPPKPNKPTVEKRVTSKPRAEKKYHGGT